MECVGPPTTPGVAQTRAALDASRPGLRQAFDAALPGARAAILGRLLGALDRENLTGLTLPEGPTRTGAERCAGGPSGGTSNGPIRGRHTSSGLEVNFATGAALPFADPPAGLTARVTPAPGHPAHDHPAHDHPGHDHPGRRQDHSEHNRDGREQAITDPAELAELLWPGHPLTTELANSVANLALARAAATLRPDQDPDPDQNPGRNHHLAEAAGDPDGLGRLEQLVTDGHPLHPCARTRAGMTTDDVLAYAPEHHPVIRLRRLAVPEDRWYGDGPPILYAHPWQAARLTAAYPWLTDDGLTEPVRPLMSLRTVAPTGGGDHYKTAVDVLMTSAVRTVSPAAVHNGPRLSALLAGLTRDLPLKLLRETSAGAVLIDGEPHRRLAYLRRKAPQVGGDETVLPLGALAVPELLHEAVDDPYGWMDALAPLLWTPLTQLLARGVALEAHGQNTLVVLRGGRPVRTLYRDLGGVRVHRTVTGDLIGDLPTDDEDVLRTKLAAAALGTVALQLVTLLERHRGADPDRLWATVAASIPDRRLKTEPLPVKATTAMRLAADPLDDRWTYLDNPMAAYA